MKRRMLPIAIAIVLCASTLVGCGSKEMDTLITKDDVVLREEKEEIEEELEVENVEKFNKYLPIMEQAIADGSNVLFSPMSLDYALGMVSYGSDGETREEFKGYFGVGVDEYTKERNKLMSAYKKEKDVDILVSNAFICDRKWVIKDDFKAAIKKQYSAYVSDDYDFTNSADDVATQVNEFVKEGTKEKIEEVIDKNIVKNNVAFFINTLYFNGGWNVPFREEQVEYVNFKNGTGENSIIQGMYGKGYTYFETENAKAFAKEYKNGTFEFVGILPDESICDENGNFDITKIDVDALLKSRTTTYDVSYMLPKFKIETSLRLKDALVSNGLSSAFTDDVADFSKISLKPLKITDVIQKTTIDINEKGTEASAATVVILDKTTSLPVEKEVKEVILDRPFAFLVYDNANDEVLFIGKISELF